MKTHTYLITLIVCVLHEHIFISDKQNYDFGSGCLFVCL